MSGGGLAGALRVRLSVLRRAPGRDALGAPAGDWAELALVRAAAVPLARPVRAAGDGVALPARWRVTMRPCDVAADDRLTGAGLDLRVLHVTRDPAAPDRIVADAEERR